jgi:two-component system, NtrC family, nitrogen regulation sensor histidine kinase GlnL
MTQDGQAFFAMTSMLALLIAILGIALLRFAMSLKTVRRHLRESGSETAVLGEALQEAVARLKAQESAMSARIAASEQLSSEIVESLSAGLLVVDRSGRVDIFNAAGRQMLGVRGEPIGADYREVLARFGPLARVIDECLATGVAIVRRSVQIAVPARPLRFGVTASPLRERAGQGGVICLFSDLTAVVELEEQLRLKDTLARLGELTAGIAHEFRNGLATIHGYSRLIDLDALPVRYRPYVEGIRQETQALGQIVTNFLNFARPEQVSFSRVDLGAVARRAADDLRHELPAGTSLTVSGEFGDVQGDDVLLRQVFGNLIRNAVEACQGAGVVPAIRIEGDVDLANTACRVAVHDNGPGVAEAARERIFQPFFTTRAQGTGLGLAIVQKIVVTHNGRVSVRDNEQGGATFQIVIPLAPTA